MSLTIKGSKQLYTKMNAFIAAKSSRSVTRRGKARHYLRPASPALAPAAVAAPGYPSWSRFPEAVSRIRSG
jgi:hypothetical protein